MRARVAFSAVDDSSAVAALATPHRKICFSSPNSHAVNGSSSWTAPTRALSPRTPPRLQDHSRLEDLCGIGRYCYKWLGMLTAHVLPTADSISSRQGARDQRFQAACSGSALRRRRCSRAAMVLGCTSKLCWLGHWAREHHPWWCCGARGIGCGLVCGRTDARVRACGHRKGASPVLPYSRSTAVRL